MPPSLALGGCLLLVAWLLARDMARRRSVGASVWVPTTMLLVVGSRPLSAWLTGGQGDGADGNPVDQVFYLSVIAASWLVASARGVRWGRLIGANLALTFCYLYFGVSVLWSEDPYGSFKRWSKVVGLLPVVAVMLSEKNPRQAIRAVYMRAACVVIPLSFILIRYFPDLGRSYTAAGELMLTGVAQQKNSLGEITMILSLFLIWDVLETRSESGRWRWDCVVLLGAAIWLVGTSQSKTSLVCLVVGVALMLRGGRWRTPTANRLVLAGGLAAPIVAVLTGMLKTLLTPAFELLGREATLTGRTPAWEAILDGVVDPLIGAGYFNFWGSGPAARVRDAMGGDLILNAHNGYLEIFLDGGLIGVALLVGVLISNGGRLARGASASRFDQLRFTFMIVAMVDNLAESTFVRLSPVWYTTLLLLTDFRGAMPGRAGEVAPGQGPASWRGVGHEGSVSWQ